MKYKIIDEEGKVWIEFEKKELIDLNMEALEQWHPGLRFTLIGTSGRYECES